MNAPVAFFKTVPLLANLEDAELQQLAGSFICSRFAQGTTIFHQGDIGLTLYLIETGQVRIYVLGEDGQEQSVILYGPRDVFGELAVIDDGPRSATAVVMKPAVIWMLSRERFRTHMQRSPQITLNFMRLLSERVRYTTQQFNGLIFLSVTVRLARKLIELIHDYGEPTPEGVLLGAALTQSDLASLVGTSRESINKTLRAFQRQGLIVMRHGQIIVINPDGLYRAGQREA